MTKYLLSFILFASLSHANALNILQKQYRQYRYQESKSEIGAYVLRNTDKEWQDLSLDILVQNLSGHTQLVSGLVEFEHLLQPISDLQVLKDRKLIIDNVAHKHEELAQLLNDFSQFEPAFIQLLTLKDLKADNLFLMPLIQGALSGYLAYTSAQSFFPGIRYKIGQGSYFGALVYLYLGGMGLYFTGTQALAGLGQAWTIKSSLDTMVSQLSHGMQILEKLASLVRSDPILAVAFPNLIDWEDYAFESSSFQQLQDNLKSSFNILPWNSETTLNLASGHRNVFQAVLRGIGRLDAYMAVLKLREEWYNNKVPVAWAEFDNSSARPSYQLTELANPLINKAIPNSYELNGHAIFNGPSTCGKSAEMKSIAAAQVLAQSILLVPAAEAKFSIVHRFETYFNVGDNIAEGLSSFKAQQVRLSEIESRLKNTAANQRVLALIDEPYRGVPSSLGEGLVIDMIQNITKLPQVSLLMSTHFEKPCKLEDIQYYQPELIRKENGHFKRSFKMLPGVADWWFINQDGKSDAFIKQIFTEN